jgi:chromosome segregation ATPase
MKDLKITKQGLLKDLNRILSNIQRLNRENDKNINEKSDKEEYRKNLESHLNVEKGEAKKLEERKEKLLQKLEQIKDNISEMKNLRETIIRTVSRLEESTRSINEEIQIKELAYLDLTKRHEELKSLYQKYHKFYETVLAERNKNVAKIHIAHQKKAEFKEKMRILTTEMDILQAELNDTNNILLEKQKELTDIKQQQTTLKQDINKKQYEYKENEQEIKKLTNENEKLHTMLSALENEMVNLRVDYELACESRNYTGIQLIDRNDELCIFYEKVQHLENQINETNKVIIAKETIVNKLMLNNIEVERFIEVNRKKMPQIPELSNKIKELDNEIKILNITLEKLIAQIEDPTDSFKKELPGEDPDIDYLKMKYDQLAYMLNNKKEILLEKELINEEINDIAEKLKNRALNERERNLEINEKVIYFIIRLMNMR